MRFSLSPPGNFRKTARRILPAGQGHPRRGLQGGVLFEVHVVIAGQVPSLGHSLGAKFQLVAWQPSTVDYEGVIGVWNTATH